ncbi:hypothetical protein EJ03DRAFT_351216 [Teratosphaeria nubilosa]|uniref:Uncharacterized protein n=1 Tax=Teratosphaeria nubilosa TaxID=161662 RepID=A0A6G1L9E9_9PEZI|nr:hypothetical protein EJ03DRAFT_351216 [Teratosphaeria nubilosa]
MVDDQQQHADGNDTASPTKHHDIGKDIEETAKNAIENFKNTFGNAVVGLQHIKWEELPEHAKDYIKNNPKMTAFQILSLLLCLIPGLIVTPLLGIMGFSGIGPVAGTAAAGLQSSFGTPLVFRAFQSAAMGGWGAAAAAGVVGAGLEGRRVKGRGTASDQATGNRHTRFGVGSL